MNLGIFIGIILTIILFLFSYCACIISSRYSRLEEEDMSILQEYEENEKIIGKGKIKAINDYIKYCTENNKTILYSDVVYKKEEYDLFEKWFQDSIKPFRLCEHSKSVSVLLDERNFWYDLSEYGLWDNGYCYNDIFKDYLENNFNDLNLNFDSENGMFCVYCENMKEAEEVIYELAKLYKDEDKMIELIKTYKI